MRLWFAIGALVIALVVFWSFRAFQAGPLLFPPDAAKTGLSMPESASNWPSSRRDTAGTGWARDADLAAPLTVLWEKETPGVIMATPTVADSRLFITTEAGVTAALDADSGTTLWSYDIGSPSDSAAAVAGDLVYLGTRNHRVLALDRQTGELRWQHEAGNIVLGSPIVQDGTLYIGSTNGKLEALDAATGVARWSADANGWVVAHPATDGEIVAAASLGERFITVDPDTGRRRLLFYSGTPVAGGPVVAGGVAYFVTNRGAVWAVDPRAVSRPFSRFAYVAKFNFFAWRLRSDPPRQTGAVWVGSARGKVKFSPAYAHGNLFVVNESSRVAAFDGADGALVWETQLDGVVVAEPVVAGDTLILGTSDGQLHGLDGGDGSTRWTHQMDGLTLSAAPSVSGRTLFLPTTDGRLIALQGK